MIIISFWLEKLRNDFVLVLNDWKSIQFVQIKQLLLKIEYSSSNFAFQTQKNNENERKDSRSFSHQRYTSRAEYQILAASSTSTTAFWNSVKWCEHKKKTDRTENQISLRKTSQSKEVLCHTRDEIYNITYV